MAVITDGTTTGEDGVLVGKFDAEAEYDIELRVADNLGGESTRYEQLRCQETSFNISDEGDAVSVGKYATRHKCFDSAWDIHSDENIESEKDVFVGNSLYLQGTAVTASAEEINHCKGLKDNAQKQLDNKADKDHYHWISELYADDYGNVTLREKLSKIDSSLSDLLSKYNNLASKVDSLENS